MKTNDEVTTQRKHFYLPGGDTDCCVDREALHFYQIDRAQMREDYEELAISGATISGAPVPSTEMGKQFGE